MGLDRFSLWRIKDISFWKLLGAGKGETFTPRDADPQRWGLLVVANEAGIHSLENSSMIQRWRKRSISEYTADLSPISVHGRWSRRTPFDEIGRAHV